MTRHSAYILFVLILTGCAAAPSSVLTPPGIEGSSPASLTTSPTTFIENTTPFTPKPGADLGSSVDATEARAHPPELQCTMPPAYLSQQVDGKETTIIDVIVPDQVTVDKSNPAMSYRYNFVSVHPMLIAGATPTDSGTKFDYTVSAALPLKSGSEYILFVQPTNTSGGYFIEDGLRGAYQLSGPSVSFQCPNYENPAEPATSSGQMIDAGAFRALIMTYAKN